jgi:hypothetical protein
VYRHLRFEMGWKQKVAGYVIYAAAHHQALYQTPALSMLSLPQLPPAQTLKGWTEEALNLLQQPAITREGHLIIIIMMTDTAYIG